jgi:predicted transcriptional regulator
MRLREVAELLDCEVVAGANQLDRIDVDACFAADLMSDVLAFSRPGALLVTGLASLQSAHTADVADLAGVVYVSGKRPAPAVVELAGENGLPLLTTPLAMFETCGRLFRAGLASALRRGHGR